MIFPWFKITNTSTVPIDHSTVKIRYYYTMDGDKGQNFWCDWSTVDARNVTGSFTKLAVPVQGADYYLELGFKSAAGMLQPGQSIQTQNRFAKTDWSDYTQTNDYSFNPAAKTYVDTDKITVFIGKEIVNLQTTSDYTHRSPSI